MGLPFRRDYAEKNQIAGTGIPDILDGTGRASIYLDPGLSYKFVCQDSLGASVPDGTVDNWADRGDVLRQDLASTTDALKGAGLVGYANNAAALAGGLTAGQLYRNGDVVGVVH